MVSYDILAVDDEIHILNALRRSLRPEYNVFMATNGQNALAMMDQNDIPLIISDQRMPGMTGIELLRRVSLEHPGTIRLILTAYAADDNQHMLDAINSGQIHDCLAKPWDPEEMKGIVREGIQTYELARVTKQPHIQALLHNGVISRNQLEIAVRIQKDEEEPIEEILVKHGITSRDQLDKARELRKSSREHLGEILVALGAISPDDLDMARAIQKNDVRRLTDILIDLEFINRESIYSCYSLQLRMPYLSLSQFSGELDLTELLPTRLACKYGMIPIYTVGRILVVVVTEPLSDMAKIEVERETGYKVMSVYSSGNNIRLSLEKHLAAVQKYGEMQKEAKVGAVGIRLRGIVRLQQTREAIQCVINDIAEDCADTTVVTSDPRICAKKEEVELKMLLPTERSPIKCVGKITWHSMEERGLVKDSSRYLARISIADISRVDREKLSLLIARKNMKMRSRASNHVMSAS